MNSSILHHLKASSFPQALFCLFKKEQNSIYIYCGCLKCSLQTVSIPLEQFPTFSSFFLRLVSDCRILYQMQHKSKHICIKIPVIYQIGCFYIRRICTRMSKSVSNVIRIYKTNLYQTACPCNRLDDSISDESVPECPNPFKEAWICIRCNTK